MLIPPRGAALKGTPLEHVLSLLSPRREIGVQQVAQTYLGCLFWELGEREQHVNAPITSTYKAAFFLANSSVSYTTTTTSIALPLHLPS